MKNRTLWGLVTFLSIIGIGLALYLLYNFLAARGIFGTPSELCNLSSTFNCGPVTSGRLSTMFGIPVSVIGLVGYVVILIASLRKMVKTGLFMATFGMVFCLQLQFREIFGEGIVCPVCLMCQLVMAVVFGLMIAIFVRSRKAESA